jgi:metallophosphoesterase (TIGR00282 family)
MRILFLGDVVGRSGRDAIAKHLPKIRVDWQLDFIVVNGENATSGHGLSVAHSRELLDAGADCLTLGDHAFDQKDMLAGIVADPRIIRPINFAKSAPGKGAAFFNLPGGRKILVIQVLGQVFMKRAFEDPFGQLDQILKANPLKSKADAIFVDIHCEATSEKMAMGHWCDGRVSMVAGTHTHVPTADAMILPKGTGYISDAGMCGDYHSVIGMDKAEPMRRFVTGMVKERFTPARQEATLCGLFVETDDKTGLAKTAAPVRIGGQLSQSSPP